MVGFSNILIKLSHPENAVHVLFNASYPNTCPDLLSTADTAKT